MEGHLLLVGGAAGSTEDDAVEAARAVLSERGPVEVVTCAEPPDLEAALDSLDGRTLVIAGGDGSVHVTVAALDRRGELAEARLALVPLGTGNDLARTLGIPLDPAEAAALVLRGSPRSLDLMRVVAGPGSDGGDGEGGAPGRGRGRTIVNAAHAGIGVAAAASAADLKGALGPAAYPAGAVAAGVSADPVRVHVEVDGVRLGDGELLLVGIGNGRTVGGGTALFPAADPADGLLEVVAVADVGVWDRLRLGFAVRNGAHPDLDGVLTGRGREVLVTGSAAWNDDGELGEPEEGRRLTVEPGAWRLLC